MFMSQYPSRFFILTLVICHAHITAADDVVSVDLSDPHQVSTDGRLTSIGLDQTTEETLHKFDSGSTNYGEHDDSLLPPTTPPNPDDATTISVTTEPDGELTSVADSDSVVATTTQKPTPAISVPGAAEHKDGHHDTPDYIDHFYLWTRSYKNGDDYELLDVQDEKSIKDSSFVEGANTYVIIHGFVAKGLEPWIHSTKDKLLHLFNCNVISVSWQSGESYSDYNTTTAGHVAAAGNATAELLKILHTLKQLDMDKTHIIGHCLGAHVAAFAGQNTRSPLARITGLDPAGPNYRSVSSRSRLSKGDATYVDVIHTNDCNEFNKWDECFGIRDPIGHTDFFPNGGQYQPKCKKQGHHKRPVQFECDHQLAHDYFLESFDYSVSSTMFLSRPAESYFRYIHDPVTCGPYPQYMGYYAGPGDGNGYGTYYSNTTASPPFAFPDPACPARAASASSGGLSASASSGGLSATAAMFVTLGVVALASSAIILAALKFKKYHSNKNNYTVMSPDLC